MAFEMRENTGVRKVKFAEYHLVAEPKGTRYKKAL